MDAPYTLSTDVFWVGGGYMSVKNMLSQIIFYRHISPSKKQAIYFYTMTISYVVHNVSILLNIILLQINHVPYNCSSSNSFKDCPVFNLQFVLPLLFIPNTKEEA